MSAIDEPWKFAERDLSMAKGALIRMQNKLHKATEPATPLCVTASWLEATMKDARELKRAIGRMQANVRRSL